MRQPRLEIESYSVAYFECITKFDALLTDVLTDVLTDILTNVLTDVLTGILTDILTDIY